MKTITINVPDDCEVKIVRKEEEKKEPVIKTYKDMMKSECLITGFRINENSEIVPIVGNACDTDKNIATTEKVAKSMLAMAIISQLMPYYGGAITDEEWKDWHLYKYCIFRKGNNICTDYFVEVYKFLAFHTKKQKDEFLKYNEQLVKDYLMID